MLTHLESVRAVVDRRDVVHGDEQQGQNAEAEHALQTHSQQSWHVMLADELLFNHHLH